jgi:hypothetical protein
MPGLAFFGLMFLSQAFNGERIARYGKVDIPRIDPRYLGCDDDVIITGMDVQWRESHHRLPPRQGKNTSHFTL